MNRRLVRVYIPSHVLLGILREGREFHFKVVKGLPITTKFISDHFDLASNRVCIICEDDSFAEVGEGEMLPIVDVAIEEIPMTNEEL